jgi:hypothetical protein
MFSTHEIFKTDAVEIKHNFGTVRDEVTRVCLLLAWPFTRWIYFISS